jgi:hypothetical protein
MAELFSSCHQDTKALRKNEIISLCLGDFVANCFGYFSDLSGLGRIAEGFRAHSEVFQAGPMGLTESFIILNIAEGGLYFISVIRKLMNKKSNQSCESCLIV